MLDHVRSAMVMFALTVLLVTLPAHAAQKTTIKVGVYDFPPIATVNQEEQASGLLGDLLTKLEADNSHFTFRVIHTSPKRRHLDFQNGLFDVMFFEHPDWSWNGELIDVSDPVLVDEEVYLALDKKNRDQSFFNNIEDLRIVAMAGYHYGFADSETDESVLKKRFNIELSHSHRRNLNLIEADRPAIAEVAVVSRSFLNNYFARYPQQRDKFLVSDKIDQTYALPIIARKNGSVTLDTIKQLLQPMIDDGRYQTLVKKHGLQLPDRLVSKP